MEALNQHRSRDFVTRLTAHLQSLLAGSGVQMSAEELSGSVETGIQEAPRYALTTEKQVARYIEIACLNVGGLQSRQRQREEFAILYTYGLDPTRKLDRYQQWAEAARVRNSQQ
jgi:hypothetical protein